MKNSKSEIRSTKQTQSSKLQMGLRTAWSALECGGKPVPAAATPLWPSPIKSAGKPVHSRTGQRTLTLGLVSAVFCFLSSVLCLPSSAQFALDWWTIDGGAGTSTGGVYSVSGTIGQPDAGPALSGGQFTLNGGFWGVIAAVQTPEAPLLSITLTNSFVVVSWPLAGAEGWFLEATNALPNVSTPWPVITPPYHTNGANLRFIEPVPTGNRFYRLQKP